MSVPAIVLLAALWLGLLCGSAAAAPWRLPVEGPVVGHFRLGPDPFAPGQRRGVDLRGRPGARVVAPCGGRVSFAGLVPGRGAGVSLRCGALTATVLGLGALDVRAGLVVSRGERLGAAGSRGRIRLGARVSADRFGYRDPLELVGRADGGPSLGPAPAARRIRPAAPAPPMPAPPVAAAAPDPRSGPPLLAWAGLALVALALPAGALLRGRRRAARRAWAFHGPGHS